MSRIPVPGMIRMLYTHNPFYLISAVLFLYGLQVLLRPGQINLIFSRGDVAYIDPWWLMMSLCGITLLMALTAFLIVRLGKVWEDARSLVLVLLFMFLAISVSFDEIVTLVAREDESLRDVFTLFGFGLTFSLCVSAGLIRGLRIGLPWGYRAPLYGLLGLFFAFPFWVSPEVADITAEQARWRIMAFPVFAGVLTLCLLPAVRRGSGAVRDNGTPWRWPWFPWTVFVFLAGAVCFRSYSLAISFDVGESDPLVSANFWDTSFGLYFLVPFLLAALFVLLEIGLVERLKRLKSFALLSAALLPLIAYPSLGPLSRFYTNSRFVNEFVSTAASPVFLALIGLAAFYGYAWLRGVRGGELGLVVTLFALVFTGPKSLLPDISDPHVWPLGVLGILEMSLGVARGRSKEVLSGACAISLAIGLQIDGTQLTRLQATVTFHLVLGSLLIIGGVFRDPFALFLRKLGAVALAVTCPAALLVGDRHGVSIDALTAYAVGITILTFVWGFVLGERLFFVAGFANCAGCTAGSVWWSWQLLQATTIPDGVRPLFWGGICFAVAVFISVLKGGLATRIQARWGPVEKLSNSTEP